MLILELFLPTYFKSSIAKDLEFFVSFNHNLVYLIYNKGLFKQGYTESWNGLG